MNLGQAKTKAIQYIREYSNDGVLIPAGENQDYLLSMNSFANDAQVEISDIVGIDASYSFTQTSGGSGYNKYSLPTDFKELKYINLDDERFYDFRIENGKLVIPKSYEGTFELFYHKHPTTIDESTNDSYVFEIEPHAQIAIPYYLGGMVIADENPALSSMLLNMYYNKLSSLTKKNDNKPKRVRNVFSY